MAEKPDLCLVHQGTKCRILMYPKVADQFRNLDAGPRATLLRCMQRYADGHTLPTTMFTFESRESRGSGKDVAVYAFKAMSIRVYGVKMPIDGSAAFVCSEIDVAKKQQKADPGKLQRAAKNVSVLFDD